MPTATTRPRADARFVVTHDGRTIGSAATLDEAVWLGHATYSFVVADSEDDPEARVAAPWRAASCDGKTLIVNHRGGGQTITKVQSTDRIVARVTYQQEEIDKFDGKPKGEVPHDIALDLNAGDPFTIPARLRIAAAIYALDEVDGDPSPDYDPSLDPFAIAAEVIEAAAVELAVRLAPLRGGTD